MANRTHSYYEYHAPWTPTSADYDDTTAAILEAIAKEDARNDALLSASRFDAML